MTSTVTFVDISRREKDYIYTRFYKVTGLRFESIPTTSTPKKFLEEYENVRRVLNSKKEKLEKPLQKML